MNLINLWVLEKRGGLWIGRKGLTIIELVVVLSILSILLSIATPSFHRHVANTNLRTAARDMASDIAALKERAIAENASFTISFDQGQNSYTFSGSLDVKSPGAHGNDVRIANVGISGGVLTFQSRGTVTPTGDITLTNGRNSTAIINVNISGRTSVQCNFQ